MHAVKSTRTPLLHAFSIFVVLSCVACHPAQPYEAGHSAAAPQLKYAGNESSRSSITASESCKLAAAILNTCAYESSCVADMMMFLPSAARSQYVRLSGEPWFSEEAFDRYCVAACEKHGGSVDFAAFAHDVCKNDDATSQKEGVRSDDATKLVVRGLALPVTGIRLSEMTSRFGEPERVVESPYTCDSAFDTEAVKLYAYPNVEIETDGDLAVPRLFKVNADVHVMFGSADLSPKTEVRFRELTGTSAQVVGDHLYRTSLTPNGDLESSLDFQFVNGYLESVRYWIGC